MKSCKKILFLGANGNICGAVKKANDRGYITYVADYFEDSPAKKYAAVPCLVSTADIDQLVKICKDAEIDAIFTGYSEKNLSFASALAERTNLPFYANSNQIEFLSDKELFKKKCISYCVPVTKLLYAGDGKFMPSDFGCPCVIKPVDSYSGKGITIVNDGKIEQDVVDYALSNSVKKRIIVEECLDLSVCDAVTAYYTIYDGVPVLSSFADRLMYSFSENRQLNTAIFYPSHHLNEYLDNVDKNVTSFMKEVGLNAGVFFLEGAVYEGNFKFWECGFRLCGAQQGILTNAICGVDCENQLIDFAITGKMPVDESMREDPNFYGKYGCNLLLFSRPGRICEYIGLDYLSHLDYVVNLTVLFNEGHTIHNDDVGTLNQNVIRLHLTSDTKMEMISHIRHIFDTVKILDGDGNNLLLESVDYSSIEAVWGL